MAAGILVGPHTPGIVLFDQPDDLELLAAFGLIFLMFYLGLELSVEELSSGGRKLLIASAAYLTLNIGGGIAFGFAVGWGTPEAFVIAGVIGISSSAIVTKVLVELPAAGQPGDPAHPGHHRHRGPVPGALPGRHGPCAR